MNRKLHWEISYLQLHRGACTISMVCIFVYLQEIFSSKNKLITSRLCGIVLRYKENSKIDFLSRNVPSDGDDRISKDCEILN